MPLLPAPQQVIAIESAKWNRGNSQGEDFAIFPSFIVSGVKHLRAIGTQGSRLKAPSQDSDDEEEDMYYDEELEDEEDDDEDAEYEDEEE